MCVVEPDALAAARVLRRVAALFRPQLGPRPQQLSGRQRQRLKRALLWQCISLACERVVLAGTNRENSG